jgi:hypothetical protein
LRCPTQTAWALPSIDNRWPTHTKCLPPHVASANAAVLLSDSADRWEGTVQCVPRARRESRETLMLRRLTQAPPCRLRSLSSIFNTNACTPTVRLSDRF